MVGQRVPCGPRKQMPPTCQAYSTPQGPQPRHPSTSLCANPNTAILGGQSSGGLGWALGTGRCDGMEWNWRFSGESTSSSPRVTLDLLIITHFTYNSFEGACWVSPPSRHHTVHFCPFFGQLTQGFFSSKLSIVSIEKLSQDTFQELFSTSGSNTAWYWG